MKLKIATAWRRPRLWWNIKIWRDVVLINKINSSVSHVFVSLRWFYVHLFWRSKRTHQLNHVFTKWNVAKRSIDLTFWLNLVIHAHYLANSQMKRVLCEAKNNDRGTNNRWWNTALFFSLIVNAFRCWLRFSVYNFFSPYLAFRIHVFGYINHLQRMQNRCTDWELVCFLWLLPLKHRHHQHPSLLSFCFLIAIKTHFKKKKQSTRVEKNTKHPLQYSLNQNEPR